MISIITPCFNASKFISNTITSIKNQTYNDWELIIVDDCSTDGSIEIIESFTASDKRIKLIKNHINKGVAEARNTALKLAKGRYVAFLDSDDMWCEGKLEKQLAFMKQKNAAISCTAMNTIDEEDNPLNTLREVRERISYKFLLKNTMIATSTVLIDRNKTGDFQMPLRRGGQDYATWLMLMRNGTICYGLNEVLSHYRVMSESLSSNKWKSITQVWQIQTQDEKINKLSAAINVCFFIMNAFMKHFIK